MSEGLCVGAQLETVIIFTSRIDVLAQFYQQALDIGPYERAPGHLGCQVGAIYLGFDQVDGAICSRGGGVTLWFTVDDLQATFDHIVDMGGRIRSPPEEKPWGARLASVYDPDGNVLGLSQRRETG
jgi:predicted enzyme related to lactoylglutathione lyase